MSRIVFVFLLSSNALFAAGGENCDTPTDILALPFSDSGTTCSALDDYNETCPFDENGAPDVVYRFMPARDIVISVNLCESLYDTKVYVYAGSCPASESGLAIACNDDACGVNGWRSHIPSVNLQSGTIYFIVVDGWGADCGTYQLVVEEVSSVSSDLCDSALSISLPWAGTVTTCGLSNDYNEACPFPAVGAPDAVIHFVASENGDLRIDLCSSDYDTKIYVYAGSCPAPGSAIGATGSGTAIACNDDACGVNGWRSKLPQVPVIMGADYYLVVDGFGSLDCGSATIVIDVAPPPQPGETCELAFEVSSLPFVASGVTSGVSRFEHQCQFIFGGAPEHIYTYMPVEDSWISVGLCSSNFDTKLTIAAGPCPLPMAFNGVVIGCNDDSCGTGGTRSRIDAARVTAGEPIFIVVDGSAAGEEGNYELHIALTCAPDYPSVEISEIAVGARPIGLAIRPDGARLFGTNFAASTLSVIDTSNDSVEATVPVGAGPYRVAVSPDGNRLYVVEYWNNTVRCIDTYNYATLDTFSANGPNPLGLAIAPSGLKLYVGTEGDGTVRVWSIPDHQLIGAVSGLGSPRELLVSPDGTRLFISDFYNHRVWDVDTATLVATEIAVDYFPQALLIEPDGEFLLVANFGYDRSPDHASVFRIVDRALVARLRVGTGPEEMAVIPGTEYLLVTEWGFSHHPSVSGEELGASLGSVTIVRLPDFELEGSETAPPMIDRVVGAITHLGDYNFGLAVLPDGTKAYAAQSGYGGSMAANFLSVIGFTEGAVVGRFRRGDANADGAIDIGDPITILQALFQEGSLACGNAADANDDNSLDIADAITLLSVLFADGAPLPRPVACGTDPTPGPLCCEADCL